MLDELSSVLFSLFLHISGDVCFFNNLSDVVLVDKGSHLEKVDDAAELFFCADGELDRNCVCLKAIADHSDNSVKVRAHDVHLVDIAHTRNTVLVSLTPNGFRLRLNAALCTKNCYRTVKYTKRTFNFNCEVNVAGGVDDVDSVVVPITGCSSRGDCDTSFLFLFHPVHGCAAVVSLTHFVSLTGVVQNSLGCCCLTSIDMRHDTDVSGSFKRIFSSHLELYSLIIYKTAPRRKKRRNANFQFRQPFCPN